MTKAKPKELPFSKAWELLKKGKIIARLNWDGAYLFLVDRRESSDGISLMPHTCVHNADGAVVPWVPSHSDLLADDWFQGK